MPAHRKTKFSDFPQENNRIFRLTATDFAEQNPRAGTLARPPKNKVFSDFPQENNRFFRLTATDFAEQNPRAGTLARPYRPFRHTDAPAGWQGHYKLPKNSVAMNTVGAGLRARPPKNKVFQIFRRKITVFFALRRRILLSKIRGRARWPAPTGLFGTQMPLPDGRGISFTTDLP